ncbi:MAG: efflux RND transporter permease subunit, partial [Bacillota bacterium]
MDFLTRFSLKNGAVIFLAIVLVLAGGWYSLNGMKSEALPDIEAPFIWMSVVYPGATPHDVSKEITEPLDKALQGLNGLKNLTTEAYQNYGVVVMEFDFNVDLDNIVQEVNNSIQTVELPAEAQKSPVHKANISSSDVIRFAVSGPGTQEDIAQYISEVVKPKLVNIPGVESVGISGVAEKKVFVKLDPDQMRDKQVSPEQVKQALQYANLSIPAGQVTMDDKLIPIEVKKQALTLDDIKRIRLVSVDTGKIFQDAIGSVGDGFSQFADALSQMGAGMQQGFSAVSQMQILSQTQIRLLGGIQSLMLLISQDQAQLQALQGQGAPPAQLEGMKMKLEAEQAQLQGLMDQLDQVNKQVAAAAGQQETGNRQTGLDLKTGQQKVSRETKPEVKVITLGDVADVSYGYEKKTMLTRTNGEPGVTFALNRQSGANVVDISDRAQEIVNELNMPDGYKIDILFDMAEPIKQSVNSMVKESLLGAIFAILVIFIFLRNFRATIVAITAIPLSIFATFIILKWLDYTINIMTLSGMAVAVGRVVDDGIVVIENIFRRLSSERGGAALVREATGEVASAITSSTITTVAVFAPLALVSGIVGKVFVPFAITVVVSLLFSLLVAVTVVPLMGRVLLTGSSLQEKGSGVFREWYGRVLVWSLKHKLAVVLIALLILLGSGGLATQLGTNFLPQDQVWIYQAGITMPVGSSLEKTDRVASEVEDILKSEPGVKTYQTAVHDSGSAEIFIVFKDEVEDTKVLAEKIRSQLKQVEGAQDISLQELGQPGGSPVLQVVITGNDFESIKKGGQVISDAVRTVPGLANVTSNIEDIKPQIEVKVNEEEAARKGFSPLMEAGTLRAINSGDTAGKIEIEGKQTEIVL